MPGCQGSTDAGGGPFGLSTAKQCRWVWMRVKTEMLLSLVAVLALAGDAVALQRHWGGNSVWDTACSRQKKAAWKKRIWAC